MGNLADTINYAIDALPSSESDYLHMIREIGNFGAHARRDVRSGEIVPVVDDEAKITLQVLEKIMNYFFVNIPDLDSMKKQISKKLKEAEKKPLN